MKKGQWVIVVLVIISMAASPLFAKGKSEEPGGGGAAAGEAAASGFWGWSTLEEYEADTGKKIRKFAEAPILKELVDKGELPPVADRLPEEPCVDLPFEDVGAYGGTLRLGMLIPSIFYPAALYTIEYMLNLDRKAAEVVPNIAKKFEFADDGKTFTLYLRRGMRWSDGAPFTADDIMFYWDSVVLNDEVSPVKPAHFSPGGELMKVEKVDDFTVRFRFAVPYWTIPYQLSGAVFRGSQNFIFLPAHALEEFHIDYNEDADKLAKDEGYDHWWQLFNAKRRFWIDYQPEGIPSVAPWVTQQILPEGVIWERNPYYFKIDTAGNQLPYMDKVTAKVFTNTEQLILSMVAGEYDYQDWSTAPRDYPVLLEGAEQAGYNVWVATNLWGAVPAYYVNQNYAEDPAVAEVLQDVRFRQALSLGINRDEMNQLFGLGRATPRQATVHPAASFYKEEWGNAFADYDPEAAKKLLDEMGMDELDKDGFRLGPNGEPFTVVVAVEVGNVPAEVHELVGEYWQALGIRAIVKVYDRSLLLDMFASASHMIGQWIFDGASELALAMRANPYLNGWIWGQQWSNWRDTGGAGGVEPPAEVKRMFELYTDIPFMSPEERGEAFTEIFDIWEEGVWGIGTIGMSPKPAISSVNLGNVCTDTYTDNSDVGCGTFNRIYQFYWKE